MIPPFKAVVYVLPFASSSDIDDAFWYQIETKDEHKMVLSFIRRSNIPESGPSVLFLSNIYIVDAPLHSKMDRQQSSFCIIIGHHSTIGHSNLCSSVLGTFVKVSIQIIVLFGIIIDHLPCCVIWYDKLLSVASNLQTIFKIVDVRIPCIVCLFLH